MERLRRLPAAMAALAALALAGCMGANPVSAAGESFSQPCPALEYWGVFWSPDSRMLAAIIYTRGREAQLYALDARSGAGVELAGSVQGIKSNPHWSPDSRQIAFTTRFQNKIDIYIADTDGDTVRQLTHGSTNDVLPAWSPSGERLAYAALDRRGAHESTITTVRPDGSDERVVVAEHDLINDLAWSPGPGPAGDGGRIAYTLGVGHSAIFSISPDGGGRTRLTDGQGDERAVSWSADGKRITFLDYRDNRTAIAVVNADGSGFRRLTTDLDERSRPAWLPDPGKAGSGRIAFVSHGPANHLTVIDAGSGAAQAVTPSDIEEYYYPPSWSSDGAKAAFVAYDHSNPGMASLEIYTINRDGSGLARLTDNPGKYRCFHWPF